MNCDELKKEILKQIEAMDDKLHLECVLKLAKILSKEKED